MPFIWHIRVGGWTWKVECRSLGLESKTLTVVLQNITLYTYHQVPPGIDLHRSNDWVKEHTTHYNDPNDGHINLYSHQGYVNLKIKPDKVITTSYFPPFSLNIYSEMSFQV
jgi:hypothetical protein